MNENRLLLVALAADTAIYVPLLWWLL